MAPLIGRAAVLSIITGPGEWFASVTVRSKKGSWKQDSEPGIVTNAFPILRGTEVK
jgi:hypothetical protein